MMLKTVTKFCSAFIACALLLATRPCLAEGPPCEEQAKECLTRSGTARETCLNRIACSQATFGSLLSKRTQLAPSTAQDNLEGPAFLGPQIIDRRCVANFDSALSAALIKGPISAEGVEALSVSLDQCLRSYAPDITRP
jgi:hypothetical protein